MRAECYLASVGAGGEQRPLHMMTAGQWLRPQSRSPSSERVAENAENAAAATADAGLEPALVEGLSGGQSMSDQQQRHPQPRDRTGDFSAPDSGEMPTGEGDEEEPDASLLGAFLSDSASAHGLAYWLTASTVGVRALRMRSSRLISPEYSSTLRLYSYLSSHYSMAG